MYRSITRCLRYEYTKCLRVLEPSSYRRLSLSIPFPIETVRKHLRVMLRCGFAYQTRPSPIIIIRIHMKVTLKHVFAYQMVHIKSAPKHPWIILGHGFAYQTIPMGIQSAPIYPQIVHRHGFAYQTIPIYTNAQPICTKRQSITHCVRYEYT